MQDYGNMVRQLMQMATPVANKNNPLNRSLNPGTEGGGRSGTGGGARMGSRAVNPDGSVNAVGRGTIDRADGKQISDNPYFPGTKSFAAWEQGFKGK
jgi:hypothetical protein